MRWPYGRLIRCFVMMTMTKSLYARASAAAIAATVALSPIHAAPKPIIDLSESPALSDDPAAAQAAAPAEPEGRKIGPLDERTAEIGGGALALLALGSIAVALRSRKRKREDAEAWNYEALEPAEQNVGSTATASSMRQDQTGFVAPDASAFSWGKTAPCEEPTDDGSDRCPGETWVERAHRGPSPANPSMSLKTRLARAAFFDKREREVAAGKAAPIDPEAGLPERMVDEQERETA